MDTHGFEVPGPLSQRVRRHRAQHHQHYPYKKTIPGMGSVRVCTTSFLHCSMRKRMTRRPKPQKRKVWFGLVRRLEWAEVHEVISVRSQSLKLFL
jgi:hypothetical protein